MYGPKKLQIIVDNFIKPIPSSRKCSISNKILKILFLYYYQTKISTHL